MLTINRKLITYISSETRKLEVSHYVLIAEFGGKSVLLSHPNLFLYKKTRSSRHTSKRYAGILVNFYKFLSTQEKMIGKDISTYHLLADNRDIMRWQADRQSNRLAKQSAKPSTESIIDEAHLLMGFFHWLSEEKFPTNVNVNLKTWRANFRSRRMLNYLQSQSKVRIDASNIQTLDRRNRQKKFDFLISDFEIKVLLEYYVDPVYAVLFTFALGTAMRPMDIVKFPYIGNADNTHILPYSEMTKTTPTVNYTVYDSKGHKDRTIIIHMEELRALQDNYITPYYSARKKLYKDRTGQECPPDILFLNKYGIPVTADMISARTNRAKANAMKKWPEFRPHIDFYQTRHWWPTQYLIATFGDMLLTESTDALVLAVSQVIINQLGHEDIITTYRHYIDMARVMWSTHKGQAMDLISSDTRLALNFTKLLQRPGMYDGAGSA
ncbi:site-specific integrase [Pseudomonas putida]|uniref:site-specific integrase n=1 Tax=Pseudomonas putida TaxID=303 RepID=UPI0018A9FC78|nr:site-specific integrase [Pseudomonas putida]MBF8766178.1 site-specific integrase [Pseudomonas putida]